MTQEEKELLLKDLSARLPYGVKVQVEYNAEEFGKTIEIDEVMMIDKYGEEILLYHSSEYFNIEELKPYLRPMSSMTAAEVGEYISLKEDIIGSNDVTYFFETHESIDWLNQHHFDYRGLTKRGLALKVPEGMYKIK